MHSAIRFSRSQSHSSRSTPSEEAGAAADVSQAMPSAIPSASTHSLSQRTKSTHSGSRSRSRHSDFPTAAAAAATTGQGQERGGSISSSHPWVQVQPSLRSGSTKSSLADAAGASARGSEERDDVRGRVGGDAAFPFAVPNLPWIPPPPLAGAASAGDYAALYYASMAAHAAAAAAAAAVGNSSGDSSANHRKDSAAPDAVRQSRHRRKKHEAQPAAFSHPLPFVPPPYGYPAGAHPHHHYPPFPFAAPTDMSSVRWPTPDQIPLPSTFPMPPHSVHPVDLSRRSVDLFPPPPLPPWWFLQAMHPPAAAASIASYRPCGSRHHSDDWSSSSRSTSSSSFSSSSSGTDLDSSPSDRGTRGDEDSRGAARRRSGRPPSPTPHVAPAGSVETPSPAARRQPPSTSTSTTTATRSAHRPFDTAAGMATTSTGPYRAQPGRVKGAGFPLPQLNPRGAQKQYTSPPQHYARPSHVSTSHHAIAKAAAAGNGGGGEGDAVWERHAPPVTPQNMRPSTARQDTMAQRRALEGDEEDAAADSQRVHDVLATAESYLSRMEALYQRLRHRYEEVLLSPVKERAYEPQGAEIAGRAPQQEHHHDAGQQQHHRVAPHGYSLAEDNARVPSPAIEQPVTAGSAGQLRSSSPTAVAGAASTHSLRHELAMLESRWLRLEELKHRAAGEATTLPHAALGFAEPSSLLRYQPASSQVHPALSRASAAGTGPISPPGGLRTAEVMSNQSVMELINDRKQLLSSAA